MPSDQVRTIGMLVVVGALLIAVGIGGERVRGWIERNVDRAPLRVLIASLVVMVAVIALAATGLIPFQGVAYVAAGLTLVAATWGWLRYRGSAQLRRWADIYDRVGDLVTSDPDATDRLIAEGRRQDEADRERLRSAAMRDPKAAREFQRRTRRELDEIARLADATRRRFRSGDEAVGLRALADRRRSELEADLRWIEAVIGQRDGAA